MRDMILLLLSLPLFAWPAQAFERGPYAAVGVLAFAGVVAGWAPVKNRAQRPRLQKQRGA
jgi:hypothetical protein